MELQSFVLSMGVEMKANEWMDIVSERLQRQWPSVDPARLDDLAADLWADARLRAMEPGRAAEDWLRPVTGMSAGGAGARGAGQDARFDDASQRVG